MRRLLRAKAALLLGSSDPVGRALARIATEDKPLEGEPEERADGDSPEEIVVENVDNRLRSILDDMNRVWGRLHEMMEDGDSDGFIQEISSIKVLASGVVSIVEDIELLAEPEENDQQGE